MPRLAKMGPTTAIHSRRMKMRHKLLLIATTAGLSLPNFGFGQSLDTTTTLKLKATENSKVFSKAGGTAPEKTPAQALKTLSTTTTSTLKIQRDLNGMKGGGVIDGGGGDEVGMAVQADAVTAVKKLEKVVDQKTLSKLQAALNGTKYFVVDDELVVTDAAGNQQFSAAKNFPSTGTIYVQRRRYSGIKEENKRQYLMGHELLSLVGVEKTGDYHISSRLLAMSSSTPAPTSDSKGDILYNEFYNADPKGYLGNSAADICQEKKDEFADQYYFVYCSYWRKPIKEGYSCESSGWGEADRWGHSWGYSHGCGDEVSYVYGLRVYGLGKNSELTWKTVFSSKAFGPENSFSDEYDNEEDAQSACMMNMIQNGEKTWTKPRCVVKQDGSQFYYEVQTRSPLVHSQK